MCEVQCTSEKSRFENWLDLDVYRRVHSFPQATEHVTRANGILADLSFSPHSPSFFVTTISYKCVVNYLACDRNAKPGLSVDVPSAAVSWLMVPPLSCAILSDTRSEKQREEKRDRTRD